MVMAVWLGGSRVWGVMASAVCAMIVLWKLEGERLPQRVPAHLSLHVMKSLAGPPLWVLPPGMWLLSLAESSWGNWVLSLGFRGFDGIGHCQLAPGAALCGMRKQQGAP